MSHFNTPDPDLRPSTATMREILSRASSGPTVESHWTFEDREPRPAAVLIPLYLEGGEWHVLLTERTQHVAEHRGQVAFPGGKVDKTDASRVDTALRETEEEIGLPPGAIEVLGTMPDFVTSTRFHVTPVVGVIPWPAELRLSEYELDGVFGVPLRWLADPEHLRVEIWTHPVTGEGVSVYFYDYKEHTIWGATARMLNAFVELVKPHLAGG